MGTKDEENRGLACVAWNPFIAQLAVLLGGELAVFHVTKVILALGLVRVDLEEVIFR